MQHADGHSTNSSSSSGGFKALVNNLPVQLTSLIGREQDVKSACDLLQRPNVRLLTLTGTGGVGKTRLALEIAKALRKPFPGGISFVSMAPISNPGEVIPTIAHTLGIREVREAEDLPLFERLKVYLRSRQFLLLIDSFEQVVTAAPLLIELLQACPDLKIIVTSRAGLHVRGEYEFQVQPLPLPDPKHLSSQEDLEQYAATALFISRAKEIKPDFQLTPPNAPIIAEICARLDGLPLAIELAAARIKLLSPQQMLTRLEHRLHVLTSGGRDFPVRHQTLRNTIQWSYDLLSPAEQRLFRRASVFAGSCTLRAIEVVCGMMGEAGMQVLDGLESLHDKNLLHQAELPDGETLILMLETIREYGLEQLEAHGEVEETRHAHARFYLTLAEEAEAEAEGPQQVMWLDALERVHENLRQALHWLLESEETELALRLAGALWWFWMVRGHLCEGRQWLEKALAKSEGSTISVKAKALSRIGILAYAQGDFQRADTSYQQASQLFQELGNKERGAVVLYRQGLIALMRGNQALATSLGEEALRTFRALNYKRGIADTLLLLAYVASTQSEYDRARMLIEESLALFREAGDKWGMAYTLSYFAHIVFAQGNYAHAYTLVEESLAFSKELDFRGGIASCLEVLAEIVAAQKQKTWAVRLWGAAEALREIIGGPQFSLERSSYEGMMATIRSELGEEVFAAAWAEGRAVTPEQVLSVQAQASIPVKAPAESTHSASTLSSPTSLVSLTARELEILRLLATGLRSAQIAEKLSINLLTVNTHVRSIYSKLGVTSRSAATRYAIEHKIV